MQQFGFTFNTVMHPKDAEIKLLFVSQRRAKEMTDSVDPDQTESDLGLHCLPKTYLSKYIAF